CGGDLVRHRRGGGPSPCGSTVASGSGTYRLRELWPGVVSASRRALGHLADSATALRERLDALIERLWRHLTEEAGRAQDEDRASPARLVRSLRPRVRSPAHRVVVLLAGQST